MRFEMERRGARAIRRLLHLSCELLHHGRCTPRDGFSFSGYVFHCVCEVEQAARALERIAMESEARELISRGSQAAEWLFLHESLLAALISSRDEARARVGLERAAVILSETRVEPERTHRADVIQKARQALAKLQEENVRSRQRCPTPPAFSLELPPIATSPLQLQLGPLSSLSPFGLPPAAGRPPIACLPGWDGGAPRGPPASAPMTQPIYAHVGWHWTGGGPHGGALLLVPSPLGPGAGGGREGREAAGRSRSPESSGAASDASLDLRAGTPSAASAAELEGSLPEEAPSPAPPPPPALRARAGRGLRDAAAGRALTRRLARRHSSVPLAAPLPVPRVGLPGPLPGLPAASSASERAATPTTPAQAKTPPSRGGPPHGTPRAAPRRMSLKDFLGEASPRAAPPRSPPPGRPAPRWAGAARGAGAAAGAGALAGAGDAPAESFLAAAMAAAAAAAPPAPPRSYREALGAPHTPPGPPRPRRGHRRQPPTPPPAPQGAALLPTDLPLPGMRRRPSLP
eukprot:tig00021127_g18751.t1